MLKPQSVGAIALALALANPAHGQEKKSAEQRARMSMEAIALDALAQDTKGTYPTKNICSLQGKGLLLPAYWQQICNKPQFPPRFAACIKEFLACEVKEGTAQNMPSDGTFDCDGRLSRCQASQRTSPPPRQ